VPRRRPRARAGSPGAGRPRAATAPLPASGPPRPPPPPARLPAVLDRQLAPDALQGRQHADLVTRHTHRAGVVRQGAGNALPDPPGGVGAKLESQAVLVLVHRPHQAAVAFLDEVGERQAPAAVALGDRHYQPQVALGQLAPRLLVADVTVV